MKKLLIAATLLTIGFSAQASEGRRNIAFKNSMAGFASESIEESMELLYRTSPTLQNQVMGASVELLNEQDSTVVVSMNDGSELAFNCLRFEDTSNSGTVIKKEVVCRR